MDALVEKTHIMKKEFYHDYGRIPNTVLLGHGEYRLALDSYKMVIVPGSDVRTFLGMTVHEVDSPSCLKVGYMIE